MFKEKNLLTLLAKARIPKHELSALRAWLSTFFVYQARWLLEPARFAMCLKSRQIGMSHSTAGACVLWAAYFGETTTVISTDLDTAGEVIVMALKHAKVLERLGSHWAKCRQRGNSILFENGGRIIARPASSGGRGFSGNVFLDEFAYMEDPERVCDAALAVAIHGYSKVRISSTPNGVGNEFHSFWTNPKKNKGWVKHQVDLRTAQAAGLAMPDETCWALAKNDPRVFGQMFLCSFLDGNQQYIPTELVQAAILENTQVEFGEYYAGYDVGKENDFSALVLLRQTPDHRVWVQQVAAGQRVDWDRQLDSIVEAFNTWPIKRLHVDETGMGAGFVKSLQQRLGTQRVVGVNFTLQSKAILATDMHQAFADKMIHIPNDRELVKDILSIRRIITDKGNVTYDAPVTAEGHADRAWGLALAINACANKPCSRVARGPGDFSNT